MDLTSPNLNLPYIAPAQAQKHVTHNEALRQLDALVQLSVSAIANTPPQSPQGGQRLIIGAAPSGAFEARAFQIAAFQDGAWVFYAPKLGWRAFVEDDAQLYIYKSNGWEVFSAGSADNAEIFGVNTAADSFNRFAVKSPASLLDNDGAGHQLKVNKAAQTDTASLLFQSGYTGHAEMGLTGGTDFHIKSSPDGSAFKDSVIVKAQTGIVDFPYGQDSQRRVAAISSAGGGESFYGLPNTSAVGYQKSVYIFANNRVIFHAIYVDRRSELQGGLVSLYQASTTVGAVIRAGLYALGGPSGDQWEVGARVVDFGTLPADVAGQKYFTATTPIVLEPGWYATAIGINGAGARARALRAICPELQNLLPHNDGSAADFRFSGPSNGMQVTDRAAISDGFLQPWPTTLTPVTTTASYGNIVFIPKWAA